MNHLKGTAEHLTYMLLLTSSPELEKGHPWIPEAVDRLCSFDKHTQSVCIY